MLVSTSLFHSSLPAFSIGWLYHLNFFFHLQLQVKVSQEERFWVAVLVSVILIFVITYYMARVNTNILGISELKWTGMAEFSSDEHYIYYCGQESLRRNGVALIRN